MKLTPFTAAIGLCATMATAAQVADKREVDATASWDVPGKVGHIRPFPPDHDGTKSTVDERELRKRGVFDPHHYSPIPHVKADNREGPCCPYTGKHLKKCRKNFPDGYEFRYCSWDPAPGDVEYTGTHYPEHDDKHDKHGKHDKHDDELDKRADKGDTDATGDGKTKHVKSDNRGPFCCPYSWDQKDLMKCRKNFPDGYDFRYCSWDPAPGDVEYTGTTPDHSKHNENDDKHDDKDDKREVNKREVAGGGKIPHVRTGNREGYCCPYSWDQKQMKACQKNFPEGYQFRYCSWDPAPGDVEWMGPTTFSTSTSVSTSVYTPMVTAYVSPSSTAPWSVTAPPVTTSTNVDVKVLVSTPVAACC